MRDDLETLRTEYESAHAEMLHQHRIYERAKQEAGATGDALIEAMMEAGLTEYGPITSSLEWHEPSLSHRRIWSHRAFLIDDQKPHRRP